MPVPKTSMMSKLRLFMGVFWLLTSLVMIWGYYNWSYITDDWQLVTQLMYRSGVVLSGFVGVTLIISSWANIRRGFVTPQIGNNRLIIPIEGIVYLGIMMVMLVGSLLTRQNTLLLVFAMLAGAFVVNGWQTFGMLQSAKLFRTTPKRAMAGDLFSVELTVVNRHPLLTSWMISVEDTIQSSSEVLNATILFARIANRSSQEGHYQLRLAHRGRYQFGPIVVSSRFPLGLVERSRMFSMTAEVLVYPRLGRTNEAWNKQSRWAMEMSNQSRTTSGVFHDEFQRLREFRTGDNPRDIHWRTSARHGTLVLREYQQNRNFNLTLILDFWRFSPTSPAQTRDDFLERFLSFAVTLVVEQSRRCRDGEMSFYGSGVTTIRWRGRGSTASLETLFDEVAVFEAGRAADTMSLVEDALFIATPSTRIVFLTSRPEAGDGSIEGLDSNTRIEVHRFQTIQEIDQFFILEDSYKGALNDRSSQSEFAEVKN